MKSAAKISVLFLSTLLLFSCGDTQKEDNTLALSSVVSTSESTSVTPRNLSQEFKDYWYAGNAEITSYKLSQERYGELREGTSVNIFVTEDFLPEVQVKADRPSSNNIPVLKLNNTKKYLTGIYPYSVMTSSFTPVSEQRHALKISHSMQEWCGHVYVQLNNRDGYELQGHSYFEGEADQNRKLPEVWLENEIWNRIRINPTELPTGTFEMIPSLEFGRMSHKTLAPAEVSGTLSESDGISTYTLAYPKLNRELSIQFKSAFPYTIEGWEETHPNGLTTTAKKLKQIKSAYWGQNSNKYEFLRDSLGL
ncbi:septum formation inhibitor Maf [Aureisphaera galaxeae]|uniref:septum formation inhibitor Maf n=1 Tax=Aureisphaera galaxeae TaxID=1538023 RepID=UPI00234FDC36|nr:septum formation inhibitor Maf [Aureisphaera galaxeae]MDC8003815.1 septum formation inhibitor Maf [Aureisphaera galaxeae]